MILLLLSPTRMLSLLHSHTGTHAYGEIPHFVNPLTFFYLLIGSTCFAFFCLYKCTTYLLNVSCYRKGRISIYHPHTHSMTHTYLHPHYHTTSHTQLHDPSSIQQGSEQLVHLDQQSLQPTALAYLRDLTRAHTHTSGQPPCPLHTHHWPWSTTSHSIVSDRTAI